MHRPQAAAPWRSGMRGDWRAAWRGRDRELPCPRCRTWRAVQLRLGERHDVRKPGRCGERGAVAQQGTVRALFRRVVVWRGRRMPGVGGEIAAPRPGCGWRRAGQALRDDRGHGDEPHGQEAEPCKQSSMCTETIHAQTRMSLGRLAEALAISSRAWLPGRTATQRHWCVHRRSRRRALPRAWRNGGQPRTGGLTRCASPACVRARCGPPAGWAVPGRSPNAR